MEEFVGTRCVGLNVDRSNVFMVNKNVRLFFSLKKKEDNLSESVFI